MRNEFTTGETPQSAYEDWRKDWEPPIPRPVAIRGKIIVEFSPPCNSGSFFLPEQVTNNAMVVSDGNETFASREGFLPPGTEVCYTGATGENFEYMGRKLTCLKRSALEMLVTA